MGQLKQLKDIVPIIKVDTKDTKNEGVRKNHRVINDILYKYAFDYLYFENTERIMNDITIIAQELKQFPDDKKAQEIVTKLRDGYKALKAYKESIKRVPTTNDKGELVPSPFTGEDEKNLKNMAIRKAIKVREMAKDYQEKKSYIIFSSFANEKAIAELEINEIKRILDTNFSVTL